MGITSKVKVPAIFLLMSLFVSIASAGQVDPRFDGKWVGVEIFRPASSVRVTWKTPQVKTMIGIAQSGQMLGVLSGFLPGRYSISPKSDGNTLMFYGSNGRQGRNECTLKLSADGNTFEEMGRVVVHVHSPKGWFVPAQVYGTFHRAGK
jgi:hypothetical protein